MKEFLPAQKRVEVSEGESARILREFREPSQNPKRTGIAQATISAIENGRV